MNSGSEPLNTLKERRTGQGFSFSTSLRQATQPDVRAKLSNCSYWLLFIETHAAHLPDSSHGTNRLPLESVRALHSGFGADGLAKRGPAGAIALGKGAVRGAFFGRTPDSQRRRLYCGQKRGLAVRRDAPARRSPRIQREDP